MDHKFLKSYNKELMKMEMLKHEKIFREQVHELHRLYRVQKLLMSNMERRHDQASNVQVVADSNYNRGVGLIDESEIQLTLGPSVYNYQYQHQHQHQHQYQKRLNSGQSLTKKEDFTWNFTPSSKNNARQVNLGEEHLRQDRMEKHLPWLFQPLSLKLT